MSMNIRSHLRVNLADGYFVEFKCGETLYHHIRLLNVGCGGCCIEWDRSRYGELSNGALLESLVLCHEHLPGRTQKAQVIWVMGGHLQESTQPQRMLIGLRFIRPAPEFQIRLHEFVSRQLGIEVVA